MKGAVYTRPSISTVALMHTDCMRLQLNVLSHKVWKLSFLRKKKKTFPFLRLSETETFVRGMFCRFRSDILPAKKKKKKIKMYT